MRTIQGMFGTSAQLRGTSDKHVIQCSILSNCILNNQSIYFRNIFATLDIVKDHINCMW